MQILPTAESNPCNQLRQMQFQQGLPMRKQDLPMKKRIIPPRQHFLTEKRYGRYWNMRTAGQISLPAKR